MTGRRAGLAKYAYCCDKGSGFSALPRFRAMCSFCDGVTVIESMENYYAGRSALIVDSKRDDFVALREILAELGMAPIAAASSANMAVSFLDEQPFDFCFVAYDLGRGAKSGLQVVQEATLAGTRRFRDAFVLVLGGNETAPLEGILEYAPDALIAKPYDPIRVRQQLDKLARVKAALLPLEEQLDSRQWQAALEQQEHCIERYPGLQVYLQRLRGLILLRLEQYEKARALFCELSTERGQLWARVGEGIALYRLRAYPQAQECLAGIIGQHQLSSEAFLWLARCYRIAGQWGAAQTLLRKAVMLQPSMPELQADLANLLAQGGDWEPAVVAYRAAVRFARYAPFQRAEHYYGLVRALLSQIDDSASPRSHAAESEAVKALEEVLRDFMGDAVIQFRARLMTAEINQRKGERAVAEQAEKDALERFRDLDPSAQAELIDLLLDGLSCPDMVEIAQEMRREVMRQMATLEWGRANLAGMQSYRKAEFDSAYTLFCRADELRAGSPSVRLNLVQAGLEVARRMPQRRREVIGHCDELLYAVQFGALSDRQQERYRVLWQRLAEIQSQG